MPGSRNIAATGTISGASSEEALTPFPTPEISSLVIQSKPSAKIAYTYYSPSKPERNHPNPFASTIVIFLNGLLTPRSTWDKSIQLFLEKRIQTRLPYPALLTYDRYGQGESDRDPDDKDPPPCHGHDVMSAAHSFHDFLHALWKKHIAERPRVTPFPALILVCNSIGCAIARLFAQAYPGNVSGLLFLDSTMTNSDFVSFWPDPDQPGFDDNSLPPGISENDVRDTRKKFREVFGPDVPNMEGLSRRNMRELLPSPSYPKLVGYNGMGGPYLTIVEHDWDEFAEQCLKGTLQTPKPLTMLYLNPTWHEYNNGLGKLTDEDKVIGPFVAIGCGHFIQRDDPGFVSDEIMSLLDRVVNRNEQLRESETLSSMRA